MPLEHNVSESFAVRIVEFEELVAFSATARDWEFRGGFGHVQWEDAVFICMSMKTVFFYKSKTNHMYKWVFDVFDGLQFRFVETA